MSFGVVTLEKRTRVLGPQSAHLTDMWVRPSRGKDPFHSPTSPLPPQPGVKRGPQKKRGLIALLSARTQK